MYIFMPHVQFSSQIPAVRDFSEQSFFHSYEKDVFGVLKTVKIELHYYFFFFLIYVYAKHCFRRTECKKLLPTQLVSYE